MVDRHHTFSIAMLNRLEQAPRGLRIGSRQIIHLIHLHELVGTLPATVLAVAATRSRAARDHRPIGLCDQIIDVGGWHDVGCDMTVHRGERDIENREVCQTKRFRVGARE